MNRVMNKAHGFYLLHFALFAESIFDVLQVCPATGKHYSGEEFVLVAGELQLVPYVGKDFLGAGFDDVVQCGQFNGASVVQRTYGGCLGVFLLFVEGVAVLQLQVLGVLFLHLQ